MAGRWVDVGEASRELGVSSDAVRKRIARGSLESSRQDGSVLVWLGDGGTEAGREAQVDGRAVVEDLREQVHYLRSILNEEREARRRADMIIAQLTQANAALAAKVPELEPPAPPEPREEPDTTQARPERVEPVDPQREEPELVDPRRAEPERAEPRSGTGGPQESAERPRDTAEWPVGGTLLRPWWRRVFGG
jgi:hypothetical protein